MEPPFFAGSPFLAILAGLVAVSFSAILIRWSDVHPIGIAFNRLVFTCLLLSPLFWVGLKKDWHKLIVKDVLIMFGVGAVLSAHFALWITSLEMTTVVASNILVTAHPIFVGTVAFYVLGEKLLKINFAGILVSFCGVVILSLSDWGQGTQSFLGDLLAFLGGIAAGTYILGGRHFRGKYSLGTYTCIVYCSATFFLLICMLAFGVSLGPYPKDEYVLFILMALGPGLLGHTGYNWALRYVRATFVSVSLLGEPIGSGLLAWLLLNELPPSLTLFGGMMILAGLYMVSLKEE
jgi:drug/metabolite transporter (DMT)-like permease